MKTTPNGNLCPSCNHWHETEKYMACNKCRGVISKPNGQKELGRFVVEHVWESVRSRSAKFSKPHSGNLRG